MSFFGLGGQQAQPQGSINPAAVSCGESVHTFDIGRPLTRQRDRLPFRLLLNLEFDRHVIPLSFSLSPPSPPLLSPHHPITTTLRPLQIEMAVSELDMITDVFNRLVNSCHMKCISEKYLEGDLNKGEGVCIDRCTAKFFEVSRALGVCDSFPSFLFFFPLLWAYKTRSKVVCTRNPFQWSRADVLPPLFLARGQWGGDYHPRTFCAIYRVVSSPVPLTRRGGGNSCSRAGRLKEAFDWACRFSDIVSTGIID